MWWGVTTARLALRLFVFLRYFLKTIPSQNKPADPKWVGWFVLSVFATYSYQAYPGVRRSPMATSTHKAGAVTKVFLVAVQSIPVKYSLSGKSCQESGGL